VVRRSTQLTLLLLMTTNGAASLKVLCLHGRGDSASHFIGQIAHIREAVSGEFHAIQAPLPGGAWWTYPKGERSYSASSFSGAEASVSMVEQALVEGKFDCLLGFSQGAMLAAVVAARLALGDTPLAQQATLRLAVMFGAALPKPYEDLFSRLRDAGGAQGIRTLHCLSKNDITNPPELGSALAGCFGARAQEHWHGNGHRVAPATSVPTIVEFLGSEV